jgi:uncharacterized protein (TIGR00297 family)
MGSMFMLDSLGLALAISMGIIIFVLGEVYGFNLLVLLLFFLILSVFATKYGIYSKKNMDIYENERGWKNVLSNGLIPAVTIILYYLTNNFVFIYMYIASVASVTSDKFASELGVFDTPIFLWGFKKVKPGTSGAISLLGSFASLSGAFLIGLAAIYLLNITLTQAFLIGIIGYLGGFADSLFGVLEENGIGNKFTTNFICSFVGAVIAFIIFS